MLIFSFNAIGILRGGLTVGGSLLSITIWCSLCKQPISLKVGSLGLRVLSIFIIHLTKFSWVLVFRPRIGWEVTSVTINKTVMVFILSSMFKIQDPLTSILLLL